jgi:hypothetical protein
MLIEIYWQYSHFCMCLDRGGTAVLPVDTTGTYMYLPVPVRVGMCEDLHVHMASRVDLPRYTSTCCNVGEELGALSVVCQRQASPAASRSISLQSGRPEGLRPE